MDAVRYKNVDRISKDGFTMKRIKEYVLANNVLDDYNKIVQRTHDSTKKKMNIPCVDEIPELADLFHVDISDLLIENRSKLIPADSLKQIMDILNRLDPVQCAKLYQLCGKLTKPWWFEEKLETSTQKARAIIKHRVNLGDRNTALSETAYKVWRINRYNALQVEDIPALAEELDVSAHWLFCLSDKRSIYGYDGNIEEVGDIFMLLTENHRKLVLSVALHMCGERTV